MTVDDDIPPVVTATGFLVYFAFIDPLGDPSVQADFETANNKIYNSGTFLHTGTDFYDGTTRTFSTAGTDF